MHKMGREENCGGEEKRGGYRFSPLPPFMLTPATQMANYLFATNQIKNFVTVYMIIKKNRPQKFNPSEIKVYFPNFANKPDTNLFLFLF